MPGAEADTLKLSHCAPITRKRSRVNSRMDQEYPILQAVLLMYDRKPWCFESRK